MFRLDDRYRSYLIILARIQLAVAGPVRKKLDASDLVQDVLLKAYEAREQFNGTTAAEYAAWLRQILKNELADAQRRHGRKKRDAGKEVRIDDSSTRLDQLAADQTSPSQHVAKLERTLRLAEALTALPEDQRTAVELRYIAELSQADVGVMIGRTGPGVAGLLRRGLSNLRKSLAPLE